MPGARKAARAALLAGIAAAVVQCGDGGGDGSSSSAGSSSSTSTSLGTTSSSTSTAGTSSSGGSTSTTETGGSGSTGSPTGTGTGGGSTGAGACTDRDCQMVLGATARCDPSSGRCYEPGTCDSNDPMLAPCAAGGICTMGGPCLAGNCCTCDTAVDNCRPGEVCLMIQPMVVEGGCFAQ